MNIHVDETGGHVTLFTEVVINSGRVQRNFNQPKGRPLNRNRRYTGRS